MAWQESSVRLSSPAGACLTGLMAYETIQALIDKRMTLTAWCQAPQCNHHTELGLHKLRDKLGPDAPCMHDDLAPKLRCAKCGSKKVGLRLGHETGKDGVWDGTRPDAYPDGRPNLYERSKGR